MHLAAADLYSYSDKECPTNVLVQNDTLYWPLLILQVHNSTVEITSECTCIKSPHITVLPDIMVIEVEKHVTSKTVDRLCPLCIL